MTDSRMYGSVQVVLGSHSYQGMTEITSVQFTTCTVYNPSEAPI